MKEIVILSGKGGTGKTSFAAAFAVLAGEHAVVADCDVDAADLHLLLDPEAGSSEAFFSGQLAQVDPGLCLRCGACTEVCRFGAVQVLATATRIDPLACEGCGYCGRVCPTGAIRNSVPEVGVCRISNIRTGASMAHAALHAGADNSGKLVAKVKQDAKAIALRDGRELILVDGSPGVGCPVISSLSGAGCAVLVTECTVSGLHDLKRVQQLVRGFGIVSGCIINKSDLNPDVLQGIKAFLREQRIPLLAEFPWSEAFSKAISAGRTIVEWDSGLADQVRTAWRATLQLAGLPRSSQALLGVITHETDVQQQGT